MPIVPLFGFSQQSKSATVTAQRHLNLYAQIDKEAEKAAFSFFGTPGSILRTSFGDTPVRGWIAVGDLYYAVHRGTLYSVNNAGTKVSLGTLNTTTGRVDMAYNGTLILIVDGTNLYTLTLPSTFAQVTVGFVPDGARTCAWLAGWFIVDDGESDVFFISEDGITWDALDFASAESNPDGLVRVFVDNGQVVLAGENTSEFWGISGATDFPFAAIAGATQEFGLAARWSLCKFNSGLAALMKPRMGQVQVMFFQGYVPRPISTQEIDAIINEYATVSDATFYAYMLGGHPMLQCNFPAAGKSWLYDASTGLWSPLEYGLSGARHRGELHIDFVNKPLIADYENGNVYELQAETYTDNGVHIAREIVGRHVFNGEDRSTVDQVYVDMETGVGLVRGVDNPLLNYLNLTGFVSSTSGGYASTPDSAAVSITGDIDIRVHLQPNVDWTSGEKYLIGKGQPEGLTQFSYYLHLSGGNIKFRWSATGVGIGSPTAESTASVPFAAGEEGWVRATLDVDNGAGGKTATFYTSEDGVTWTALGAAVTTAGTTSIYDSTSDVTAAINKALSGKIFAAYIYDGIGGTLVASMVAADATSGATSWVSEDTGETWTLNGTASIANDTPSGIGVNPQAMLQVSKDNGHTWGLERWNSMGAIGKYRTRMEWRRFGVSRDWTFKWRITDPIKVVITFAALKTRRGK